MGDFKESIDWDSIADHNELDEWLGPAEMSESDVLHLERLSLRKELEDLAERMLKSIDRHKYYGEAIDPDEFEFLHREVLRLRKNFS